MKTLEVLLDPNPILREKAQRVNSFDGAKQELIDDMIYTMRQFDGIGLAAPQVGVLEQIIVAEFESKEEEENVFPLTVVVNPKIKTFSKEKVFMLEGCLSLPGKELYIKRPKKIDIEAQDRWGKPVRLQCSNLLARVLQHEIDHLQGVLMIDRIKAVKTVFIGNGTLGIPALEMITDDPQFSLLSAITSNPRPAGRERELQQTAIATAANHLGIKALLVDTLKNPASIEKIKVLNPQLIILADYGEIIPKEIINIPKYGILNIHPSLLPKYRGPSPIVSAMLAGEKKIGISIIKINEKVDAGEILAQIEMKIKSRDTAVNLKNHLSVLGAKLLAEVVPYYLANEISPIKQNEKEAVMTEMLKKNDGKLRGDEKPEKVDLMVRALYPWPGVYLETNKKKIFITKVHLDREKLVIDRVKPESKREMAYKQYLAGNPPLTFRN